MFPTTSWSTWLILAWTYLQAPKCYIATLIITIGIRLNQNQYITLLPLKLTFDSQN